MDLKYGSSREAAVSHLGRREIVALRVRLTNISVMSVDLTAVLTATCMVSLVRQSAMGVELPQTTRS